MLKILQFITAITPIVLIVLLFVNSGMLEGIFGVLIFICVPISLGIVEAYKKSGKYN